MMLAPTSTPTIASPPMIHGIELRLAIVIMLALVSMPGEDVDWPLFVLMLASMAVEWPVLCETIAGLFLI